MASARFKGGKMALSVELHKKFKGFQMDVAFEHDGGSLGILGGSGMGKSMTLKMIAGLVKPDSGKVIVDGRIVYDSAAKIDMPARERHIGYLFQQYALFPHNDSDREYRHCHEEKR